MGVQSFVCFETSAFLHFCGVELWGYGYFYFLLVYEKGNLRTVLSGIYIVLGRDFRLSEVRRFFVV